MADDARMARLSVRLTPRSSRDRVIGWDGETLRLATTAPPVDDKANKSVVKFLAKTLGVAAKNVSIEVGRASRAKLVAVAGLSPGQLKAKLDSMAVKDED